VTIEEAITFSDEAEPNTYSDKIKLHYTNELEGKIQLEVMLISPADIVSYTENTAELLVGIPYDDIYPLYLTAHIQFLMGEYDRYQNTQAMFNRKYEEYAADYVWRYRPLFPISDTGS